MTTTTTMIAWTQATYGGPETVTRNELPVIEPGPGQILIDVAATALNSADVRLMRSDRSSCRVRASWSCMSTWMVTSRKSPI